jgi:hypothetical protein
MEILSRLLALAMLLLTLSACGCGGSPWRYDPGAPQAPSGVVAAAGDGKVTVSWSPAAGAASYIVYCSTTQGAAREEARKVAGISGTSATLTDLENGTRYYLAVSSVNANGESTLSEEVSAVALPAGPFRQSDLEGSWRFNILEAGSGAKWMRGTVVIDGEGRGGITSFLDSSRRTAAPDDLFGTLSILPDGVVTAAGGVADFHGALSANTYKDLLVATASGDGGSRMIALLQKRVPGITYSAADLKGTGRLVAGPLPLVYHQLSTGAASEWEHASLQVGQDQGATYLSLDGSTPRPLPGSGSKVVTFSVTADGVVAETAIAGVVPQPAALITEGTMSADKLTIVGTATDARGAHVLRVIQLLRPPAVLLNSSDYTHAKLAGSYAFHSLTRGAAPLWGHGLLSVSGAGVGTFTNYTEPGGSGTLSPLQLMMDQQGIIVGPSIHGKLSYPGDLLVATGTDAAGAATMSIALKR